MYTFRTIEVSPDTALDPADTARLAEDMAEQGWIVRDWKTAVVGDTCAYRLLVTMMFERREDNPDAHHRYVSYDSLHETITGWRDRQVQALEADEGIKLHLEGAIEAFEKVLEATGRFTKWM
jgi:hypothetical protein